MNAMEEKTLFVIHEGHKMEILVEREGNCTCILDTHGYVVMGAWRDPEVAQRVWDNPQNYIGDSQELILIKED